jgi:hypothetical protein
VCKCVELFIIGARKSFIKTKLANGELFSFHKEALFGKLSAGLMALDRLVPLRRLFCSQRRSQLIFI